MAETMTMAIYRRALEIAEEEADDLAARVLERLRSEFPQVRRVPRTGGPSVLSWGPPLMKPQPRGARLPVIDRTKIRLVLAIDTLTIVHPAND